MFPAYAWRPEPMDGLTFRRGDPTLFNAARKAVADQQAIAGTHAKDAVSEALAALQKALNTLERAITSGNADQVVADLVRGPSGRAELQRPGLPQWTENR